MVKYRRLYIPGATYFFTVALLNRQSSILTTHIEALGVSFRSVRQRHPFRTIAMVVLPEHLHVIWELPENDSNFSLRWQQIKKHFAKSIKSQGIIIEKNQYQEHALWQRRFWEHLIRNENDLNRHIDYIHYNPIKHKLVKHLSNWPHSTFHQYVREGTLPSNWCATPEDLDVE